MGAASRAQKAARRLFFRPELQHGRMATAGKGTLWVSGGMAGIGDVLG